MKKIVVIFVFLFLYCTGLHAEMPSSHVAIVYLGKLKDIGAKQGVGGLPELATFLKESRAGKEKTLFIHGGDALAPSVLSSFDRGVHMVDTLNMLSPDAMGLMKSSFSFNTGELLLRTKEAAFPFLSSNIVDTRSGKPLEGITDYAVFPLANHSIGFFSVVDPTLTEAYLTDNVAVTDVNAAVLKTAKTLRDKGVDIVVVMIEDQYVDAKALLEKGIVDVVLLNYEHDRIIPVSRGLFVENAEDAGVVARLELDLRGKGAAFAWNGTASNVALAQYSPDSAVSARIKEYQDRLSIILSKKIGRTLTPMDTRFPGIRVAENAFGNLCADALRQYFSADIALLNGGGIRGDRTYEAGEELTRGTIQKELPFRNKVVLLQVTGAQLRSVVENGLSQLAQTKGRFLHFSGLRLEYNPDAPVGNRIVHLVAGNDPVTPERLYTVATIDFIAKGGDGFDALHGAKWLSRAGQSLYCWDVVMEYIAKLNEVSPKLEGRIKAVQP